MRITQKGSAKSLDDLSPEMSAEVEKTLASGKSENIVISQAVNGNMAAGSLAGSSQMNRCESCAYEFPSGFPSCPQCGAEKKRSFWSLFFGN